VAPPPLARIRPLSQRVYLDTPPPKPSDREETYDERELRESQEDDVKEAEYNIAMASQGPFSYKGSCFGLPFSPSPIPPFQKRRSRAEYDRNWRPPRRILNTEPTTPPTIARYDPAEPPSAPASSLKEITKDMDPVESEVEDEEASADKPATRQNKNKGKR